MKNISYIMKLVEKWKGRTRMGENNIEMKKKRVSGARCPWIPPDQEFIKKSFLGLFHCSVIVLLVFLMCFVFSFRVFVLKNLRQTNIRLYAIFTIRNVKEYKRLSIFISDILFFLNIFHYKFNF